MGEECPNPVFAATHVRVPRELLERARRLLLDKTHVARKQQCADELAAILAKGSAGHG